MGTTPKRGDVGNCLERGVARIELRRICLERGERKRCLPFRCCCLIGAAAAFGWLLAYLRVPAELVAFMKSVSDNPIVILLMVNIMLLGLGTFMDMSPLIIITTPIFLPVVTAYGVDPVQFGVIMVLNLGIGLCTPPVGAVLFVGCAIGEVKIEHAVKTIWPFYLAILAALMLTTYVPALLLMLPGLFQ